MFSRPEKLATHKFHSHPDDIILHVSPGSQYSLKTIVALESRKLPHFISFVSIVPNRRVLPSGRFMVPELEYKGKAINDSSEILRFLDQQLNTRFFPEEIKEKVEELDGEAETVLDAICDYFNYVDEEGFEKSLLQSMSRYVPWWAFFVSVRKRIQPTRVKKAEKCKAVLKCDLNRDSILTILNEKMDSYEGILGASNEQRFLLQSTEPTAADIAIFAKICRLTDNLGDVSIGSDLSIDDVIGDRKALRVWYRTMEELSPRQWKGKRVMD